MPKSRSRSSKAERLAASSPSRSGLRIAKPSRPLLLLGLLGVVVSLVGGYLFADWWQVLPETVTATYVGRESCLRCHQAQADAFHGSHHDLAMDRATPETVLGQFDGSIVTHYGITSRVYKDGERFMIETEGPNGSMGEFEVKYVFGVEPLQQYMVEFDRPDNMPENEISRLQVLRVSWDTEKKEWFYLSPPDVDEKLEPNDPLHWTGVTQCWNTSCAECHSTNLKKNFDPKSGIYHTTFSEIDVSCEACHGPGSVHVDLAEKMSPFWDRKRGYGLAKLKTESNISQIETCAPCHSRRRVLNDGYHAGDSYHDFFSNELIGEMTYFPDGQIKDEDYVYGSFIQSKMFHQNIRCTDCHDPHSTRVRFEGNLLCTSCHQHPAGKYDTPAHHQHSPNSTGAQCVNCHMPATTYMAVDARRDHSIRVPRPDVSVQLGTPNACTGCHLDTKDLPEELRSEVTQYLDWLNLSESNETVRQQVEQVDRRMADKFLEWYGEKEFPESFAKALLAARSDAPNATEQLAKWALDRKQSGMVRATMALELARFDDPLSAETALEALNDDDPMVVAGAMPRLETLIHQRLQEAFAQGTDRPDLNRLKDILPAVAAQLQHPSRLVRIEAARVLATVPGDLRQRLFEREERKAFDDAFEECIEELQYNNDRAAAYTSLGILYELTGRLEEAETAYRTGIRVEPLVSGPRSRLADMLESRAENVMRQAQIVIANGNRDEYERVARDAAELAAEASILRGEELQLLATDARRLPDSAELQYRYGMALHLQGREEDALRALERAYELEPDDERYVLGLVLMYERIGKWVDALRLCNELIQLAPENGAYRDVLTRIQQGQSQGRPLDRDPMDNPPANGNNR